MSIDLVLRLFLAVTAISFAPVSAQFTLHADIPYDAIPGVDPNLLSLDIYVPDGADGSNPVLIMYHGGSFVSGDKALDGVVHPKMDYYTARGWIFLSANYRLTNEDLPLGHPDQVTHPDHIEDIARSIAWTINNISSFGGDPSRIVIMGFSAGAQLVALAGTDPKRLENEGLSLRNLDGVIALDGMYDVLLRNQQFPPPPDRNLLIWTDDPEVQRDMSPALLIDPVHCTPPTLVVHQSSPNTVEQSVAFVTALNAAGFTASAFEASGLSHTEIGASIGIPGHPLTLLVDDFLEGLPSNAAVCSLSGEVFNLSVDRTASAVHLSWSNSCAPGDDDYAVYSGTLGEFTSHSPLACSTAGASEFAIPGDDASTYYLVAPLGPNSEGALGKSTDGIRRPEGTSRCATRKLNACSR